MFIVYKHFGSRHTYYGKCNLIALSSVVVYTFQLIITQASKNCYLIFARNMIKCKIVKFLPVNFFVNYPEMKVGQRA